MHAVFECLVLAIKDKGIRGVCDLVPGGGYAFDIAKHAYRLYRERKQAAALNEELAKIAAASAAEAKRVAEEVARQVAHDAPSEDRLALELYLTQVPGAVRQSLKRPDDPFGVTIPPNAEVDSPEQFALVLPKRMPYFRPGTPLPGRPEWRLAELLGTGGFGEVWLARHSLIPQPRAVKFCTDAKVRAKLTSHEGRVIARVMEQGHHANVVPLLDAVLEGEAPWLMYEYVGGGSLTELILRWRNLPGGEREALAVQSLRQLAAAVATFHRLTPAIVHRDLKPANILIAEGSDGHNTTLMITDFGIGGVAGENPSAQRSESHNAQLDTSLRGSYTPLYASPRQVRGERPDPRDDVHALGVIGFQMLTGKLFEAPCVRLGRELHRLGVSAGLIEVIGDCVDGDTNASPRNAAELADRLSRLARPTSPAPLTARRGTGEVRTPSLHTPLEGGTLPTVVVPFATGIEAEAWHVPLRGTWFARSIEVPDAPWIASHAALPGEVLVRPAEAYRLALGADTTDDDLAKLQPLAGLPRLVGLELSGCVGITDAGLMHLAYLRGLKAVDLADTQVSDAGIALLATRFPELESLDLARCANLTETVVLVLIRLRKLKVLTLPPCAETPEIHAEFAKRRPGCRLL